MGISLCKEESYNNLKNNTSKSQTSLNSSSLCSTSRRLSNAQLFPQQNFFIVDDICFDSRFESGNLLEAQKAGPNRFNLWIVPDCFKTQYETKHKVWFYFSVSNVTLGDEESRTLTFKIKNMSKFEYESVMDGMVPVYSSASTQHQWQYIPSPLKEIKLIKNTLEISFEYTFTTVDIKDPVYFAFSFPYTYTQCQDYLNQLQKVYGEDHDIYFHRELLTQSIEGRNIDLLTITAHDPSLLNRTSPELEPMLEGLFPTQISEAIQCGTTDGSHNRPYVFRKKKYILISCRVHPAETPANYMLEGLLKSLLDKEDPTSRIILRNFVFVIIPMLNPDGVYRGHFRADSKGKDLDRVYHLANGNMKAYPGPNALLKVAQSLSDERLVMYLDLHAYSTKSSGFIVGNYHEDIRAKTEMRLFATVYDIYSKFFDLNSCTFGKPETADFAHKDINKVGVDGKSEIKKISGIVHCYKLETGYYKSTKDPQKYSNDNPQEENKKEVPARMDIEAFEEIGAGIRHVILEVFAEHPMSQVSRTMYESIPTMRSIICDRLTQGITDDIKKLNLGDVRENPIDELDEYN